MCKPKEIYCLKQSLGAWFGMFSLAFLQDDMTKSVINHLMFYLVSSSGERILVIVYVDHRHD